MGTPKTSVFIAALLPALVASSQAAKPASGHGDAASCSALAGKTIAPGSVVQSAEYLPEGGTVGSTRIESPFCRVIGVATPTGDSHIGFEVWLPPREGKKPEELVEKDSGRERGWSSGVAPTSASWALMAAMAVGFSAFASLIALPMIRYSSSVRRTSRR